MDVLTAESRRSREAALGIQISAPQRLRCGRAPGKGITTAKISPAQECQRARNR